MPSPEQPSSDLDVRTLAARITRLERTNRRLTRTGIAALAVAAAALLMGVQVLTPRIEEVTGNRFILNDAGKTPRALWTMTATGPEFVLLDPDGTTRRAVLSLDRGGPDLTLSDAAGKARARIEVAAAGPTVRLLDAGGVTRARLDLRDPGPSLVLNDGTTVRQSRLVVYPEEMGLTLQRSGGDSAITLLETLRGASQVRNGLSLYSPKTGIAHAYLNVYPDGATHFGLHNAAGMRYFEQPR